MLDHSSYNEIRITLFSELGKVYFDLEDLDKAFENFKKAYKINKEYFKTLINIEKEHSYFQSFE